MPKNYTHIKSIKKKKMAQQDNVEGFKQQYKTEGIFIVSIDFSKTDTLFFVLLILAGNRNKHIFIITPESYNHKNNLFLYKKNIFVIKNKYYERIAMSKGS